MSFIRYLILVWHLRNTPQQEHYQFITVLMKSGLRCSCDFLHATDEIQDERWRDYFRERAHEWRKLFDPEGLKNYRQQIHYEMFQKDMEIRKLKERLEETNKEVLRLQTLCSDNSFRIYNPNEDDIPF